MHELHENLLWLGHAMDIREPKGLFDAGICAVIDVAFEELPAQLPRQLVYCRFPLNDGGGNCKSFLLQAVQTLKDFLDAGTPTIVACSAGMSRSPTIAAFALAAYLKQTPRDVLGQIAEKKSLEVNGAFWNEVQESITELR